MRDSTFHADYGPSRTIGYTISTKTTTATFTENTVSTIFANILYRITVLAFNLELFTASVSRTDGLISFLIRLYGGHNVGSG